MSGVKIKLTLTATEAGSRPDETKTTVTTWETVTEHLTAAETAAVIRNAVGEVNPQTILELET